MFHHQHLSAAEIMFPSVKRLKQRRHPLLLLPQWHLPFRRKLFPHKQRMQRRLNWFLR